MLLLSYLLQSLSLVIFALTLSCSLSLSPTCRFLRSLDSPSDDHCCPMSGKQFRWCCSSDDDDDRDADDVMMMIDVFYLTQSITQSLSLTQSLNRSLSFSLTCRFFRLLDRPSDDHCCPMSGKQFRGSCSFDTAATLMLLLLWCRWRIDVVISLTQSRNRCITISLTLALSPSYSLLPLSNSCRNHNFWQSIGWSLLSHDR